jgi:hypothetical protein
MPGKGLAARSSASSAAVGRGYRLCACGVGWCARTPGSAHVHECVSWEVFALDGSGFSGLGERARAFVTGEPRASVVVPIRCAVSNAPSGPPITAGVSDIPSRAAVLSAGDLLPDVVTTTRDASKRKRGRARSSDEGIRRRPDGLSAPFEANPARWHLSVTDTRPGNGTRLCDQEQNL